MEITLRLLVGGIGLSLLGGGGGVGSENTSEFFENCRGKWPEVVIEEVVNEAVSRSCVGVRDFLGVV